MSIALTGTGGLFTRLGKIGAILRSLNLWRGNGSLIVSSISGDGVHATLTTHSTHGYSVGDTLVVTGATPSDYNGTFTVVSVPSTTTLTYATATTGASSGTIRVQKTLGAGTLALGPLVDNLDAQYDTADQNLTGSLYETRDQQRDQFSTITSYLQTLAQNTLIQMANEDTPLASQDLATALTLLISQMKTASASVQKPTISASVTAGTNTGNGVVLASVLGTGGLQMDYIINENLTLTCTADGQGSATAGQEQFSLTSPVAESDSLQWDWPLGSGTSTSLTAVDATQDNSGGNILQNGSFKTFTNSNQPDNWPIKTGTAGTTILQATGTNVYKGSSGMSFVGNGSELTSIWQPFNTTPSTSAGAGGTSAALSPSTVYALNLALKLSAVPAAGVLEVALVDGNGNIITDANGANNDVTFDLHANGTTSFQFVNAFFRTPVQNPSTGYFLRIRLSTALSTGSTLYFGHVAMTAPSQAYQGGPYVTQFSGNTNFLLNDTFTVAVSNNYASSFQPLLDRLFDLKALGLQIPSAGSPTISDTLIG